MSSRQFFVAAALIGLTVIVFRDVPQFEFVSYDDGSYVTRCDRVMQGLSWSNIVWAFHPNSSTVTGNWHPLTWISLMADVSVFGVDSRAMHQVNLALHALNVVVLFLLLHRLTDALAPSAYVAAVFAIHPLHVESVAWVSERKDVLSTLFVLLAMQCYVSSISAPRRGWTGLALVCYGLSLMTKQMYVTLPFLLLLLDAWPLRRLGRTAAGAEDDGSGRVRQRIVEKLPYLGLAVAFSAIAFAGQWVGGSVGTLDEFPIVMRILNATVCLSAYLWMTIWPQDLAVFYPFPQQAPWGAAVASSIVLGALTLVALWFWKRRPYLLVGWLWYLITLLPVIGLVQIGQQRMADRYMYFPMIGLLISVTWLVWEWAERSRSRQAVALGLALSTLIPLSMAAHVQTAYWRDTLTLFTHAAEAEESSLAYVKLGYEWATRQELDKALELLYRAVELNPNYVSAHSGLGNAYLARGDVPRAVQHFRRAIQLDPDHAESHYNLGIIYSLHDEPQQAIDHYLQALRVDQDNPSAHANLGIQLLMTGETERGLQHLHSALERDPAKPEAHVALANHYAAHGEPQKAIAHLEQVLEFRPEAGDIARELDRLRALLDAPSSPETSEAPRTGSE